MSDLISHPAHYNLGKIEAIEVIEDWKLGFHLGNVIKYICRCSVKGERLENLEKAAWYLLREIGLERERLLGKSSNGKG